MTCLDFSYWTISTNWQVQTAQSCRTWWVFLCWSSLICELRLETVYSLIFDNRINDVFWGQFQIMMKLSLVCSMFCALISVFIHYRLGCRSPPLKRCCSHLLLTCRFRKHKGLMLKNETKGINKQRTNRAGRGDCAEISFSSGFLWQAALNSDPLGSAAFINSPN